MSKTFFSLFRGGNLAGVGVEAAGLKDIGGIEYDKNIAAVCDENFPDSPTTIADIREVDPALLSCEHPDSLHASPSCRTASNANQSAETNENNLKETQEDKDGALAVCRFLQFWVPPFFTLENVWNYRNYDAFGYIIQALYDLGYSYDYWHLNAADYGVPQTRKRLILVAKFGKGQRIVKPSPTHHDPKRFAQEQLSFLSPATKPWNSWFEAIADLVPALPESKFAKWQLERLPAEITGTFFANLSTPRNSGITVSGANEPIPTVTATTYRRPVNVPKAFILDCQKAGDPNGDRSVTLRQGDAPAFTVTGGKGGRQPVRAWLVGINANDSSGAKIYQDETEPAQTVRVPSGGRVYRAWLSQGRVVKLTPRALARLQSVPDNYILPDKSALACRVIGNGVPPLLMQKIYRQLVG